MLSSDFAPENFPKYNCMSDYLISYVIVGPGQCVHHLSPEGTWDM